MRTLVNKSTPGAGLTGPLRERAVPVGTSLTGPSLHPLAHPPSILALDSLSLNWQAKRERQPQRPKCASATPSAGASHASTLPISVSLRSTDAAGSLEQPQISEPGVYGVFDEADVLQYVGVSKCMALSLTSHVEALSPQLAHHARCLPVSSGRKEELQQAWKAAIVANGSIPPGNAKGVSTWTQKQAAPTPPKPAASQPSQSQALQDGAQAPKRAAGRFSAAAAASISGEVNSNSQGMSLAELRAATAACSHPGANAAVTAARVHQLCTKGFFVVDGVAEDVLVASAQRGAEALRAARLMMPVAQQRDLGRLDEILVLNERQGQSLVVGGPRSGLPEVKAALQSPEAGSLAALAAMLKGLPHAIMRHTHCHASSSDEQQQQQQQTKDGGAAAHGPLQGHAPGSSSGEGGVAQAPGSAAAQASLAVSSSGWQPPELAVSQSLMLAVYPGGAAYYARHKDNDDSYEVPAAERKHSPAWAGPPGQRIRDRAITTILYLNKGWDAERDGGCLRIFHTDNSGQYTDVAPESGRLVVFQASAVEHEVLPAFRQRWAMTAWVPTLKAFQE